MAKFSDYPDLIAQIKPTIENNVKTAIDAANEEVGVDLDSSISLVGENYAAIKAEIAAKGVDMTGVKPSGYDAKIAATSDNYHRPSFWPEMPAHGTDENKITILAAIYPGNQNTFAFSVTPAFSVDWGDGTTDSVASNGVASHAYDYNEMSGPPNERGYKAILITITSSSAITAFHASPSGAPITYLNRCLHLKISTSATTDCYLRVYRVGDYEILELVGAKKWRTDSFQGITRANVSINSLLIDETATGLWGTELFYQSFATKLTILKKQWDFSAATVLTRAFMNNSWLTTIDGEIIISVNGNCQQIFEACLRLRKITIPNAASSTSYVDAFKGCTMLEFLNITGCKVSTGVQSTKIGYDELKRIIENDLATPATTATLTITGTPDAAAVMSAISAGEITVPAGWTIVN